MSINKLDVKNTCRVCMMHSNKMSNIFDSDDCEIVSKVFYCTGLQFTKVNGYPTQICGQCLQNLSVAHQFKSSCIHSDNTFKKLLKSTQIKTDYADYKNLKDEVDDWHCDDEWKERDEIKNDLEPTLKSHKSIKKSQKISKTNKKPTKPHLKKLKFKRLWCERCSLRFSTRKLLEEHREETHGKDEETWVCEVCGKVFVHRGSLTSHIRSHLPPEFGCDQCDYKTPNKFDLVKHVRIHNGEKLYQCQHCTGSYRTSSNLTSHIKSYHQRLRPYSCSICEKSFFDKTKFNRHVDSHNNVKRYECEVCHSCFTRRCYWKKHMQRQHNIVVPAQRPGRQRSNLVIGQESKEEVS